MYDLAAYAHDVRHHLHLSVELIRRLEQTDAQPGASHFHALKRCITRLSLLTDTVLLLASSGSGKPLQPTAMLVDIAEIADEAAQLMLPLFSAAGISLTRAFPAKPLEVAADPSLFPCVIQNLLDNALKYSTSGGAVELSVNSEPGWVTLRISDQGCGIPDAEHASVFDEYARGSNTTGVPGNGIGLALVSRIVVAHGGTIAVEKVDGFSTSFVIRLPEPQQVSNRNQDNVASL